MRRCGGVPCAACWGMQCRLAAAALHHAVCLPKPCCLNRNHFVWPRAQVLKPEVRMLLLRRQLSHPFSSDASWEYLYSELPAEVGCWCVTRDRRVWWRVVARSHCVKQRMAAGECYKARRGSRLASLRLPGCAGLCPPCAVLAHLT